MDRMSGSGVFARDADTIITLTEHSEPNCYTVETILRNLPHYPSFVVQWDYPLMVEREDLDPEDMIPDASKVGQTDCGVLALLHEGPLTSRDWQSKALALGISRATFYRIKAALKDYVIFDLLTKTWNLVGKESVENRETHEITETGGKTGG